MRYVDGFLLLVPKKKLAAYKKMARDAGKVWKKYGALEYVEAAGDDMDPTKGMGGITFPKVAGAKKDEIVFFSFILYKSKKHRDAVNKKVHAYMDKKYGKEANLDMPFDMDRFSFGGFSAVVDM